MKSRNSRLKHAISTGQLPELEHKILILGHPEVEDINLLGVSCEIKICHPEKYVFNLVKTNESKNAVNTQRSYGINKNERFNNSIVYITKSRRETFFNISVALILTHKNGNVIVNGEKNSGVDHTIKVLKSYMGFRTILSKFHGKLAAFIRPNQLPQQVQYWKSEGKFNIIEENFATVAGSFSEKKIDMGSYLLSKQFENKLDGDIADLGSGWGYLSAQAIKSNHSIKNIFLVESHMGALNAAKKNILSARAKFLWLDIQHDDLQVNNVNHVIMNPPFHFGTRVNMQLGFTFLKVAHKILKGGGCLWLVFNQELPYEPYIKNLFSNYQLLVRSKTYKVIKAYKS